jgi:toxin-antitoxin system PIN domain toxin
VIAVDTNILVYAHRQDSRWFNAARSTIASLAEGHAPWAVPWQCLHEFLGVVTHPKIFNPPSTVEQAIKQIGYWLDSRTLALLTETADYWGILQQLVAATQTRGPRIHDAHIAALCLANGVTALWTADRDFSQFQKLKAENPLVE